MSRRSSYRLEFGVSRSGTLCALCIVLAVLFAAGAVADPFASAVVDYSPKRPGQWLDDPQFNDPLRACGRPYGKSVWEADNTSVVTLGDGGSLTLSFDHDVTDDPRNPGGYDFIVFGNAIFVGGNPARHWQEPAFVEISQNGLDWFLIAPNKMPSELTASDTGPSTTVLRNYAEYSPVLELPEARTPEQFYTVPDRRSFAGDAASLTIDAVSGGGDALDIASAVLETSPGVPMRTAAGETVPAGIQWFRYLRLTDAVIGDSWGTGEISSEIDAASDVAPATVVGEAKRQPENSFALVWGAEVTAVFPNEFWIEQPDRSAGIRVVSDTGDAAEGDLVAVSGHLADSAGEKAITDALVTVLQCGAGQVRPVGLAGRSSQTEGAQGLLVRAWGRVSGLASDRFVLESGVGCRTTVLTDAIALQIVSGQFAAVTGILTRDAGTPAIRIRRAQDVN